MTEQNIFDILADLDHGNGEVTLLRNSAAYVRQERWYCSLCKEQDGVKVETKMQGKDALEVLEKAKRKLDLLLGKGFEAAIGGLLEAPSAGGTAGAAAAADDEIPF